MKKTNMVTEEMIDKKFHEFSVGIGNMLFKWSEITKNEIQEMIVGEVSKAKDIIMTGQDKIVKRLDDIDTNLTINMNDTEKLKEKMTAGKN